jgi:chromosome segregation ATPase
VGGIRDIVDGGNDLAESIEKITNNIKDITEKINDIIKRLEENDIKNKEQDNRIKDNDNKNNEQDNRLDNFEQKINNFRESIPNDIVDASPPFTIGTATFNEFKEYILNALKQLRSKMKTLTIVVGNSKNYTRYSTLLGKLEAIESGYGFMGIVCFKIIFNR